MVRVNASEILLHKHESSQCGYEAGYCYTINHLPTRKKIPNNLIKITFQSQKQACIPSTHILRQHHYPTLIASAKGMSGVTVSLSFNAFVNVFAYGPLAQPREWWALN